MKRTMSASVSVALALGMAMGMAATGLAQGRRGSACSGGNCPVNLGHGVAHPAEYRWVFPTDPADRDRVYLYRGNVQVGGWDGAAGYYRAYDAGADHWGPAQTEAPITPPSLQAPARVLREEWKVTGVDASRLNGGNAHAYTVNGKSVSEEKAFDQMTLEDDSGKLWFIPIGPAEAREKVLADLKNDPNLEEFRKHVRIWNVPADHFSLCDRDTNKPMFDTTGNPSIYLLAPSGEVLYAQNGYKPGDLEDIRKSDPSFPPDKPAPDAKKKDQPSSPGGAVPMWAILAGGSVATLLYLSKGKKS